MRRKTTAPVEKILLRVAIYIRVSTDKQVKDGDSMRDQLATGQKYIDSHENMILVDTYIDDGISGQKLKRDDFQRLIDDVRAGRIDLIIFTRLDRWLLSWEIIKFSGQSTDTAISFFSAAYTILLMACASVWNKLLSFFSNRIAPVSNRDVLTSAWNRKSSLSV